MRNYLLLLGLLVACSGTPRFEPASQEPIRVDYTASEIEQACASALDDFSAEIANLLTLTPDDRTHFDRSVLRFDLALGNLTDGVQPLILQGYVGSGADTRVEGGHCEVQFNSAYNNVFTRGDVYALLKDARPRNDNERRLWAILELSFQKNGAELDGPAQQRISAALAAKAKNETAFTQNLNNDSSTIEFTADELEGVDETYVNSLTRSPDGDKYIVHAGVVDFAKILGQARRADTRQRWYEVYLSRGGQANITLLEDTIDIRRQIAGELGYANWADLQTTGRMAGSTQGVQDLFDRVTAQLTLLLESDHALMLDEKVKYEPDATVIDSWDLPYLVNLIKENRYSIDQEAIREYFPLDFVRDNMFAITSDLFAIQIEEVSGAKVWSEGVKLYVVREKTDRSILGYFYLDLFPRQGKYSWFATSAIHNARLLEDGTRELPVAVIIGNFAPGEEGIPPLLYYSDVPTLFHEFGHVMNATLSTSPYFVSTAFNSPWDYVEIPSKLFEFLATQSEVVERVSSSYRTGAKLPQADMDSLQAVASLSKARDTMSLLYSAALDLNLHTVSSRPDAVQMAKDLSVAIRQERLPDGSLYPSSLSYIMGGYDAGLYTYLWDTVIAYDILGEMKKVGYFDAETGQRLRHTIYESVNMVDPLHAVENFLGRAFTSDAFDQSFNQDKRHWHCYLDRGITLGYAVIP